MYEYIRYPVFMLSKSVKNLISVGGVENICHQLTPICLNFKVQVEYKSCKYIMEEYEYQWQVHMCFVLILYVKKKFSRTYHLYVF